MKINFNLENLELDDYEITNVIRNRLFKEWKEYPRLEKLKDGTKALVYYTDDWYSEHRPPERHIVTYDPKEIKVIEAFFTIEEYLKKHEKPIWNNR